MKDFKVGDIVGCLPSSNRVYSITCENNNFVGRVVRIGARTRDNMQFIQLKAIKSNSYIPVGHLYDVEAQYFFVMDNDYTLSRLKKRKEGEEGN